MNAGRKRRDDATQLFASNSDNDNISEHEDEAAIMEIADALISTTPSRQPPANNQVNGFVQKAQQAWTSPLDDDDAPNGMPLNGDSISAGCGNTSTNDIDANIYNEEEAKYLTLAKEAWTEFFSDQVSQEEFLNMALDAWRDASLVTTLQQDDDDGGSLQSVDEVQLDTTNRFVEEQEVEPTEDVEVNGSQSDTASVETQEAVSLEEEDNAETTTNEQKWGMPAFLSGLFSGSKKSSDAPAEASFAEENDEEDMPYGLRMKDTSFAEENDEEELPYGLRMKSSSASVLPPPSSSSAPAMDDTATTEKGGYYALNNNINSMKAKSLGEKQVTPPISKGAAPTLKSLDKKQIMPSPSSMNKGVVKGKETSFSGGNKLSSTPPSFLNKGGTKKFGIQGKFAPKKLDIATKKKPQGKRGGLSFLKSDKLSKEYKADKNFNPMNKGVTVEKMKGLKIGQVGKAKSDDDTEASSEDGEEELEESEDDEEEPEETTLFSTPELSSAPLDETAVEKDEASKIERWNKESFKPTLKGSESAPITNTDADVESELPEGKTTTISITDQGGTDVVNPGRAFIPAPKATEEKAGIGGGVKFAVKFGTTKLGMKGGMPLKGGSKTIGGSAKLLASKSGMLKGSICAKKFGSPSIGGLLNKGNSKKIDFSLLKKGGISKGSKLPFQKSGGVAADVKSSPNVMGLKSKGAPLQPNNVLSANDTSKTSLPSAAGGADPPVSIDKSSTPKISPPPKTAKTNTVEAKKAASEGTPDKTNSS